MLENKLNTHSTDIRDKFDLNILYGDVHIPFHDQRKCRILLNVIEDLQPDRIVDGGDLVNATQISNFDKTVDQLSGLQSELNQAKNWLSSISTICPNAEKILLRDNHFYRRIADKIKKQNYGLGDLECLEPDNLLKLDELGWKSQEDWKFRNVLVALHGDAGGGGSNLCPTNAVRKLIKENGVSVIRFHTHASGLEFHNQTQNGTLVACQCGTLHDLCKVDYIKHGELLHNWTQSFILLYTSKKTKEFFIVPIYFINNTCLVNGRLYK